ncbi:hypothetical protein HPB50_024057 [Hyalomma asiaticum]|uniref:Uncharacterized protein n=1 Tax=Hyalomma asiaticum TaxID=266040 RepID=A0ACB7SW64_HYAAI|nr:hypothetical protein HPB50_024057 [Hyalomma asiaticum]
MSLLRCLLVVAMLVVHGGVLTSVNSQQVAKCEEECGGYMGVTCADECNCVFYRYSDYGKCRPAWLNETYLPDFIPF